MLAVQEKKNSGQSPFGSLYHKMFGIILPKMVLYSEIARLAGSLRHSGARPQSVLELTPALYSLVITKEEILVQGNPHIDQRNLLNSQALRPICLEGARGSWTIWTPNSAVP